MFASTFRQIEVFVAAVEAGSIAAASEKLGVSAPSVSNHIRALERRAGCALFIRRRGAVSSLSAQGRRVYEGSLALLAQIERLDRELAPDRVRARKQITIAAQRLLAKSFLPGPITAFATSHPNAEIIVEAGNYEDVIAHLEQDRADIGYVMSFGNLVDLPSTIVGREPIGIFCGPAHPLAKRKRIPPRELTKHAFVATRQDQRFGQMIESVLASIGVADYPVASRIQDGALMSELVRAGVGLMCGPTRGLEPQLSSGKIVALAIDCAPLHVDICQILTVSHRPQKLAVEFANLVAGEASAGSYSPAVG